MEDLTVQKIVVNATTVLVGFAGVAYLYSRYKQYYREARNAFKYLTINIVADESSCDEVVGELRRRCGQYQAIGFDCEWVTEKGSRNPVALLQLSTNDGYCGLFRLCHLKSIPNSLKELLEDKTIYKVGVAPGDDAKYLYNDYAVMMKSTLDIRHIVKRCGYVTGGLASLSKLLLRVNLDKSWRVRCGNWEEKVLSTKQVQYAAADAHVAVLIFAKLINELSTEKYWLFFNRRSKELDTFIDRLCFQYLDVHFKNSKSDNGSAKKKQTKESNKKPYKVSKRSKPLYHNCFMEAPDGELLCTCDVKKALWYVEKELADVVNPDPLTVRLRFEPAGRAVGDTGQYYRLVKQNCCVVCGDERSYIKKNVVPKEYRKYFPEVMKDHSCHDVVLLCLSCHQRSNIADTALRAKLAIDCNAPLPNKQNGRLSENNDAKAVRSAARAIFYASDKLPLERRKSLEKSILDYYSEDELTTELLQKAVQTSIYVENSEYEAHGSRVADHFRRAPGGLMTLEKIWRQHFLDVMKPKYIPELWSLTHNEDRLRVRLYDGRLTEEHIKTIGLTSWLGELKARDQARSASNTADTAL